MSSLNLFQKVISDPKFDPYDVFRLPRNFSMKQLTKQYHKKALRYHPDKGGDALKYNIIKYAYSLLCEEHKQKHFKAKDFRSLKEQSQNHTEATVKAVRNPLEGSDFNVQRFNENFQANKMDFERDGGYRDWIEQNKNPSAIEEPLSSSVSNDPETFNREYIQKRAGRSKKKKKHAQQTTIQVYKEPEPSYTTKLKFSDVDLSRPNTFNHTSMNPDIHFRDYRDAYTESEITNIQIKERESYSSLDALQKSRSNVRREMTDNDKMKYAAKIELSKRQENERQQRIRHQNMQITKHFETVNALMLQ